MGVPRSWLSKKYCNKQIIDENNVVSDDLSDGDEIQENQDGRDLTISSITRSEI